MPYSKRLSIGILEMMSFKNFFFYFYPPGLITAYYLSHRTFSIDVAASWFLLKCPVHFLTGWLCPTCGMTRSFIGVLRGEWLEAWSHHPLGPILFFAVLFYWLLILFRRDPLTKMLQLYNQYPILRLQACFLLGVYVFWGVSRNF